jgi:hypothetical protein
MEQRKGGRLPCRSPRRYRTPRRGESVTISRRQVALPQSKAVAGAAALQDSRLLASVFLRRGLYSVGPPGLRRAAIRCEQESATAPVPPEPANGKTLRHAGPSESPRRERKILSPGAGHVKKTCYGENPTREVAKEPEDEESMATKLTGNGSQGSGVSGLKTGGQMAELAS